MDRSRRTALAWALLAGAAFAEPPEIPVRIHLDFPTEDTVNLKAPKFPTSLVPPSLNSPALAMPYPFGWMPAESLSAEQKVIRDFPQYWAKLEALEGIDALRRQLGMAPALSTEPGKAPLPGLGVKDDQVYMNYASLAVALWNSWKKMNEEEKRRREFQAKVDGLMDYAQDLGTQKGSGPGVSIILARLNFMKQKAAARKLPTRPERVAFTETLKAWAVNPVFDSTRLASPLLDICRQYEEMTN